MSRFARPSEQQMRSISTRFAEESAASALLASPASTDASKVIAPSLLYAYASGDLAYPDPQIETALRTSPGLRVTYRQMIEAAAPMPASLPLAASSGGPLERSGEGFKMTYAPSQAEAGHTYLIIELIGPTARFRELVVFDADNASHRFALPPARRGAIQLLLAPGHDLLDLLAAAETSVLLR